MNSCFNCKHAEWDTNRKCYCSKLQSDSRSIADDMLYVMENTDTNVALEEANFEKRIYDFFAPMMTKKKQKEFAENHLSEDLVMIIEEVQQTLENALISQAEKMNINNKTCISSPSSFSCTYWE